MIMALPFAAQVPGIVVDQYGYWIHHLSDSTVMMRERLRSLDHLLGLWQWALAPRAVSILALVAGSGVLLLCLAETRRTAEPRQSLTRMYQLFAVWVLLFGPATESCTYVVVAPALAWSILDCFQRDRRWLTRGLLLASLLLMEPLRTDLFGPIIRNFANEHGSQPIGALIYLSYLLGQTGMVPVTDEESRFCERQDSRLETAA